MTSIQVQFDSFIAETKPLRYEIEWGTPRQMRVHVDGVKYNIELDEAGRAYAYNPDRELPAPFYLDEALKILRRISPPAESAEQQLEALASTFD